MKSPFTGTGVALVTPFNKDNSINFAALESIVDHCISGGAEYLVALGTTSEAVTLSKHEKKEVVNTIIKATSGRVPIVLGLGGNNTAEALQQLSAGIQSGINGILSVVPYYNKPNQDGMFAHFDTIAQCCPLPIILYNVPGRTAANMKASTTLKLAYKHKNIIAIKEASGDMIQIMEIIRDKPEWFNVISGDDALTLPMLAVGAEGVISVVANALSREFSDMVRHQMNNQTSEAKKLHYLLLQTIDLLFAEGNPAGIKALLECMGLCSDTVRLPLVSATDALKLKIKAEWLAINKKTA